MLNRIITEQLLDSHQPAEMRNRYDKKIACLVDGSVVTIDTARTMSVQLRATYNNKMHTNGALGIVWTSACGLLLVATSLFCGRIGEEALVWRHHQLLDQFPAGWARLVDKGFTHCTGAYKNFLLAYYPAKVVGKEIDVDGIRDARKQSADRYVVEIFYSRVKRWGMLQDRASWATIHLLDYVWHIACSASDLDSFLRKPHNLDDMVHQLSSIEATTTAMVIALERQYPAGWPVPCYLQRHTDD